MAAGTEKDAGLKVLSFAFKEMDLDRVKKLRNDYGAESQEFR